MSYMILRKHGLKCASLVARWNHLFRLRLEQRYKINQLIICEKIKQQMNKHNEQFWLGTSKIVVLINTHILLEYL